VRFIDNLERAYSLLDHSVYKFDEFFMEILTARKFHETLCISAALLYTLFRQSEAAHNRYENDITDLN